MKNFKKKFLRWDEQQICLEIKKRILKMSIQKWHKKIKFNLNDVAQKYQQKVLERDSLFLYVKIFIKKSRDFWKNKEIDCGCQ